MDTSRPLHQQEVIQRQCRICLTGSSQELVAPCACKGSAKFIHIYCLNEFITHKYKSASKEGQILPQTPICEICKSSYKNLQLNLQRRLLTCKQIFQNQKQRAFIYLFIISNILIFAALFAGIAIFFVKQKMNWLLGIVWYASLVVFILVLWGCSWQNFKKAIYKYQYKFKKLQSAPLSINLNPTVNQRQKEMKMKNRSIRQFKK